MSHNLKQDIMNEIGLGGHYNLYYHSAESHPTRTKALAKLGETVSKFNADGQAIVAPNSDLVEKIRTISEHEGKGSLEKTWKAVNAFVDAHMNAYGLSAEAQQTVFTKTAAKLDADFPLSPSTDVTTTTIPSAGESKAVQL